MGNEVNVVYIVKLGGAALPKQTGTAVFQNGTLEGRGREPLQARLAAGQHSVRLQVVTSAL